MIGLLILPLYFLANLYIVVWIIRWLKVITGRELYLGTKIAIHAVFWTVSLAMYWAMLIPEGSVRRLFNVVGTFWYGAIIYMLLTVGILDIIRIIYRKKKKIPKGELSAPPLTFKIIGIVAIICVAVTTVLGAVNARTLHNTEYEVTVDKKAGDIKDLNVVLVADMHMGYSVGVSMIEDMVDRINSYNPDLVVIAGDIFDNNYDALEDPDKLIELYKSIKSKYGVYAVYGNHDIDERVLGGFTFPTEIKLTADPRMDKFLEDAGIVNLRDQGVVIDNSFYLYGRPDATKLGRDVEARKEPDEILTGVDKNMPILLMDHQPRQLGELAEQGVDVDFSGHTHDGQIFPLNLTGKIIWENPCGLYKKDNMYSIVTSGVGFYGPGLRVGTRAEVVDVKIKFSE